MNNAIAYEYEGLCHLPDISKISYIYAVYAQNAYCDNELGKVLFG